MTSATFGAVWASAAPARPSTADNAPIPIRRMMLTRIANSLTNSSEGGACRTAARRRNAPLAHNTSPVGRCSIAMFQVNHGIAARGKPWCGARGPAAMTALDLLRSARTVLAGARNGPTLFDVCDPLLRGAGGGDQHLRG